MAIVQCLNCGQLLYRPDEIGGRYWQCINCGPTRVAGEAVDVPERLAQLLEEEYKRVVWQAIHPDSDPASQNSSYVTDSSAKDKRLLPDVGVIAGKQEEIAEGSHTWWIAWIFAGPGALWILILFQWKTEFRTHKAILIAFAAIFVGIGLVLYLLAARPIRRRRLRRILQAAASARSPRARIGTSLTDEALMGEKPESARDESPKQRQDAGQFRE